MTDPSAAPPTVAVAAAHPLASAAAIEVARAGGSAVDAAIAAQAVIAVAMPDAAGLGGDVLALVHDGATTRAVNGTGRSPGALAGPPSTTGGSAATVPGLVDGWLRLHAEWGRLALAESLAPAARLARDGIAVSAELAAAVVEQRDRLLAGGAADWELVRLVDEGAIGGTWRQPALADLLDAVGRDGRSAYYDGAAATAIAAAAVRSGGALSVADLAAHATQTPDPVEVAWGTGRLAVQPPMSQGVLLAMAAQAVDRLRAEGVEVTPHVLVEATEAAFAHRSSCGRGEALLDERLEIDLRRAAGRGGPRSYLHTAGVSVADADGLVVSSLISVFDGFGSAVFVPELGFVLNNRAAGFTDGDNAWGPAKRPVHTLAPALLVDGAQTVALATPGADGQVQTLLQVLDHVRGGASWESAVEEPRWRSQDGRLLVERRHRASEALAAAGHELVPRPDGDDIFGAVVVAGVAGGAAFAVADHRRGCAEGVA